MLLKIILLLVCISAIDSARNDSNIRTINVINNIKANVIKVVREIYSSNAVAPVRVRTVAEYNSRRNEFVVLDFIGIVEKFGYTAEEYTLQSDDGYILKLHRITGSPSKPKTTGKPVAYVQHCLFGSSDFTVTTGANHSLALELADAGFDVWIGNVRGTSYSRAHVKYSPKSKKFWRFSMDELATRDLPKFIDFALEKTNQSKVTFFGYSMGNTLGYMLLSEKPEYNDRINLMVSLAPVVYYSPPVNPFFAFIVRLGLALHEELNIADMFPQTIALRKLSEQLCNVKPWNICSLSLVEVADVLNMKSDLIPGTFAYYPAGTSYYVLKHYEQMSSYNRRFQRFQKDCNAYSCKANDSLEYDLSSITVPNALYYGTKDFAAKVEDVKYLKTKLRNVVAFEKIPNFNHLDFALHKDVNRYVHNKILKLVKKFL